MALAAYGPDPTDVVGRRVLAFLLDGIIDYAVIASIMWLLGLYDSANQLDPNDPNPSPDVLKLWVVAGAGMLAWALVKMVLVGVYGWTLGKLILGLRVVRFDGRPPGIAKAFIRQLVMGVGSWFGCLYWVPALYFAMKTQGHRQPADFAGNTYVIDAGYEGRLILRSGGKTHAGPPSVTREEADEFFRSQGIAAPSMPAGQPPTEPFFDKARDTYVVFSQKRGEWLQFDKKTDSWEPLSQ